MHSLRPDAILPKSRVTNPQAWSGDCPRCGRAFPHEENVEEMSQWAIVEAGDEVVCPGCATPLDRLHEGLETLL